MGISLLIFHLYLKINLLCPYLSCLVPFRPGEADVDGVLPVVRGGVDVLRRGVAVDGAAQLEQRHVPGGRQGLHRRAAGRREGVLAAHMQESRVVFSDEVGA